MAKVIFTFETPEQADACAVALSKGYTVTQFYLRGTVITAKPYCVKVEVPSDDIEQIY